MSDTRTPQERIVDRLEMGTKLGTVYDHLVLADHHDAYNSDDRLQLRANREYGNSHIHTSHGSR